MKKQLFTITFLLSISVLFTTCKKEVLVESFDREDMLENWADNMIIPAQEAYNSTTKTLHTQAQTFVDAPSTFNLEALRLAWLESYKAWQHVPYFTPSKHLILRFDELDPLSMLYYGTNAYPANTDLIQQFIESQEFNLGVRYNNVQGFPALEFMLYGLADTDNDILSYYTQNSLSAEKHKQYLLFLTSRLQSVSDASLDKWTNGYRDNFVKGIVQKFRACEKKIIKDYTQSFTREILSRKVGACVGYPSPICGACDAKPNKLLVEGRFSKIYSKTLLLEALNAVQNFYNGVPFGGSFENGSKSMYQHLQLLNAQHREENLADLINDRFAEIKAQIDLLDDNLGSEVENNIRLLYDLYDLLSDLDARFNDSMQEAMNIRSSFDNNNENFHCL